MYLDFRMGAWLVQPSLDAITRDGATVHLEPKVMEVLVCLAQHPGEPILKEKLLKTVWPDTFVTDDVLTRSISELRRAFEDDARESTVIQTIPKRGYRLLAPVTFVNETIADADPRVEIWHPHRNRGDAKTINSLVVLPFTNASGDPDAEYLSEGITEAIINHLSQLSKLRVVPRNTAFRYKKREADAASLMRELGVDAVVTGRVVQRGESLVVCAELVDLASEAQLWGERYNRQLSEIFSVQEEIAAQVSEALRLQLTGEEKQRLSRQHTHNREAYLLYLKGRYHCARRTSEDLKRALPYFQRAIQEDPGYALAYAGLAPCTSTRVAKETNGKRYIYKTVSGLLESGYRFPVHPFFGVSEPQPDGTQRIVGFHLQHFTGIRDGLVVTARIVMNPRRMVENH